MNRDDAPHDSYDGPGAPDPVGYGEQSEEVTEFQREVEYAEAEYPGEDVLTLSPWDKFQLIEQGRTVYFTLPSGTHVAVELVLPEELPDADDCWVFEPVDTSDASEYAMEEHETETETETDADTDTGEEDGDAA